MAEDYLGRLLLGYATNMTVFDKVFLTDESEEVNIVKQIVTIVAGEELHIHNYGWSVEILAADSCSPQRCY